MSGLAGLRHAKSSDLDAVVALQRAAYARNGEILGVEPMPLQADYAEVLRLYEVWLAESTNGLEGVLILERRPADLLIWSVAAAPSAQGRGVGNRLLAAADERARQLGLSVIRLYTGEKLTGNIAWYARHGYTIERTEQMPDRRAVHMRKVLVLSENE